ncbi:MAG: glycosyltransferase family 4 protein [Bacteroidales bacterium]|jgi:glycosyltransferase involved in cell wall biosynthesis|nr:glycosyltransferase family 4 protein [Bacteroidales bacterium]
MNREELEKRVLLYEEEYKRNLYFFSQNKNPLYQFLRIYYFALYMELFKNFDLSFVIKELLIKVRRKIRYIKKKPHVGYMINTLDKGGVEQVVYNIVTNSKDSLPYIFIIGGKYGQYGFELRAKGYYVYLLNENFTYFEEIVEKVPIPLINSHYCIWNLDKISGLGIKIVYTIHSMYRWIVEEKDINNRKEMYKYVTTFFSVSGKVRDYFSIKFGIEKERIILVKNGFNSKEYNVKSPIASDMKDKLFVLEDKFLFINVGSIVPVKNHLLLLDSFKEHILDNQNSELWFIGAQSERNYYKFLRQKVKKLDLTNKVKFIKHLNKKELGAVYRRANCFILSSVYEGSPNVLLESMFFQIPIISTDVGNAKELISEYGIIIPNSYNGLQTIKDVEIEVLPYKMNQDNKENLVIAMSMIVLDYDYWKKKAVKGKEIINKKYSVKDVVQEYEDNLLRIF